MKPSPFAILLACVSLSGCILYAPVDLGALGGPGALAETRVLGDGGPKIAMVELVGLISDQTSRASLGFGSTPNPVSELREALDRAADDSDVIGILLNINSPGGTVSASETVHHELESWKQKNAKPVVAYLNGLATSGGYYAAMAADEVISHPTSITGSIGVILPGVNLSGLMDRYGVEDQTIASGPFKDSGSMTRPMRPDERAQLEGVIQDLFARFADVVVEGRPKLERSAIERLADGRVFTARQALENGLIDRVGFLEDAVSAMEKRAGVSESQLVVYHRKNKPKDNIYTRGPELPLELSVELWPWRRSQLPPGFYYLWPLALQP